MKANPVRWETSRFRITHFWGFTLAFIFVLTIVQLPLQARPKSLQDIPQIWQKPDGLLRPGALNLPGSMISWIGQGNLTTYTISNTGQNGLFEPPPGWEGYDGQFPFNYGLGNGRTGEFPRGTKQYYVWGAGVWIGAKSSQWEKPRVATAAYYSDQSALSRLWQSNQLYSSNDAPNNEDAGKLRFKQKNQEPQSFQENWAYFVARNGDMLLNYNQYTHSRGDTIYRLDYQNINKRRRQYLANTDINVDTNLIMLRPNRVFKDTTGLSDAEIARLLYGDVVSDEDTYSLFGDIIPEDDGVFLWTQGYDDEPVGIVVQQRTYSWGIDDWIYLDYQITNMNDFPLDSVYIGYFMDNDVGPDAEDDLIGFDESLNLGYSYDSDFKEQDWLTSAGYMGSVFVRTPVDVNTGEEIGLTGFQTWIRSDLGNSEEFGGDTDDNGRDDLKYTQLQYHRFEEYKEPTDVRQLISSGPFIRLEPGQTITATIAIVAGESLSDLKENTVAAVNKYKNGFISAEPPPSPTLTAQPANKKVYLTWDEHPREVRDPFTGETDFSGFRVYKSLTGLESDWELLGDYDVAGDSTQNKVIMKYKRGGAKLDAMFLGFGPADDSQSGLDKFTGDEYTIEFYYDQYDEVDWTKPNNRYIDTTWVKTRTNSDGTLDTLGHFPRKISIYDKTQNRRLEYNKNANPGSGESGWNMREQRPTGGAGVSQYIVGNDTVYGNVTPVGNLGNDLPYYRCRNLNGKTYGYILYFDGMYFLEQNGIREPGEPVGQTYTPGDGDLFTIRGYQAGDIGNQSGINIAYTDDNLINGKTYYYSVTSYDRGEPSQGIPSLESSKYQNIISVVPSPLALDYEGQVDLSDVDHSEGQSTSNVTVIMRDPLKITGDDYQVRFLPETWTFDAQYYVPVDGDTTLFPSTSFDSDSVESQVSYTNPYVGYDFANMKSTHKQIDSTFMQVQYTGKLRAETADYDFQVDYAHGGVKMQVGNIPVINTYQQTGTGRFDYRSGTAVNTVSLQDSVYNFTLEYIYRNHPKIHLKWGKTGSPVAWLQPIEDPADTIAHSWMLIDVTKSDTVLKYWSRFNSYDLDADGAITTNDYPDGFYIRVTKTGLVIGKVSWSKNTDTANMFRFDVRGESVEPYKYYITFGDSADVTVHTTWSPSAFLEYTAANFPTTVSQYVPWIVHNTSLGLRSRAWKYNDLHSGDLGWFDSTGVASYNDSRIQILTEKTRPDSALTPGAFSMYVTSVDTVLRNVVYLHPPTTKDTLYIEPTVPLSTRDIFDFTTEGLKKEADAPDMNQIRVVPNPYYVRAIWDDNQYSQYVEFRHLPRECTIRIFTVAGTLVRTLHKTPETGINEFSGTLKFNLRNQRGVKIASGLYIYQVDSKKYGQKVGKFAVIMGR